MNSTLTIPTDVVGEPVVVPIIDNVSNALYVTVSTTSEPVVFAPVMVTVNAEFTPFFLTVKVLAATPPGAIVNKQYKFNTVTDLVNIICI